MGIHNLLAGLWGKTGKKNARTDTKLRARSSQMLNANRKPQPIQLKRHAGRLICRAARRTFPDEFIADLRIDQDVISEIIVTPNSVYGQDFSALDDWMRPISVKSGGSVHSHPDADNRPSRPDVRAFSKEGGVHLIIGYPYRLRDIAAYDAKGRKLDLKIV